jgi:hypothetical protein
MSEMPPPPQKETQDEMEAYYQRTRRPLITMPTSPLGRVGFFLALMFWFTFLSLPCGLFYLATVGEVRLGLSDVPDAEEHPFFQLNLITEPRQRGLKFTRSISIRSEAQDLWCIQTHVDYWLWTTDGTADNVVYHRMYRKTGANALAVFVSQADGVCP